MPSHAVATPVPQGPLGTVLLTDARGGTGCPMLDAEKRCTVYDARPLMCRMFGAVKAERLTCPFGAKAARPMTDAQGHALVRRYKEAAP